MTPDAPGRKDDQSKTPFHLLPWRALTEVVKVLAHGEKKYGAWNWIKVEPHRERYFAAAIRHLTAWWNGETIDPESGFHHLAHAICCCLFLIGREIGDTGPAPATRRFVRGADPTNETCLTCGKPIGHHFGGIEYRCDPKANS